MTTLTDRCEACDAPLASGSPQGRRRRFCGASCRSRARRVRAAAGSEDRAQLAFARAVDATIDASGRSLRQLAEELEKLGLYLSPSTLSQWRQGHHLPYDTEAVRHRLFALERLAEVPSGTLVRALLRTIGRPRDPARVVVGEPRRSDGGGGERTLEEARALLLARIASIDGSIGRELVHVEQREHYVVGPRRIPVHSDMVLTVVALVGGIDRYWHTYAYDPQTPVSVQAVEGCTARVVLDDIPPVRMSPRVRYQVAATELLFGRQLPAGSAFTFRLRMRYDPETTEPLPAPEFRRLVTSPATRYMSVSIAFDPATRPRELYRARWEPGPASRPRVESQAVPVAADGSSEPFTLTNPMPGGYGFVWEWPSDEQPLP